MGGSSLVVGVGGHTVGVLRDQLRAGAGWCVCVACWWCAGWLLGSRVWPVPAVPRPPWWGVVGGVGLLFEIWIVDASI